MTNLSDDAKFTPQQMKMATAPLPSVSPSVETADTKLLQDIDPYQVDSAKALESYADSSNWTFVLIFALVSLVVVILYFLFA